MSLSQSSFLPFAPEWMRRYSCESLIYIFTAWLQPFVNDKEWDCMIKHERLDSDKMPAMPFSPTGAAQTDMLGLFKRKSLLWCLILTKITPKISICMCWCHSATILHVDSPRCYMLLHDATCLSLANENIAAFSFTKWKTLYFGNVSCARIPFKCNMPHL